MNILLKILLKQLPRYFISFGNFRDEYTFVSFYIWSLFTNIPLKKIIKIIWNRVYSEKKDSPALMQRSLKKLLLDTSSRSFFNKKYIGNKGKHLLKQYMTKIKRNCTSDIKFAIFI